MQSKVGPTTESILTTWVRIAGSFPVAFADEEFFRDHGIVRNMGYETWASPNCDVQVYTLFPDRG